MSDKTEKINGLISIRELYMLLGVTPPDDFDDIPVDNMIVIKLFSEDEALGMAAGFIPSGSSFCGIKNLYLKDKALNSSNIITLLEAIRSEAGAIPGISSLEWRYVTSKDDIHDPYIKIARRLSNATTDTETLFRFFELDLHNMLKVQPHFKEHDGRLFERNGFEILKCSECDEKRHNEIEEMLESADEELLSLQPFDGSVQDEDNSLFLIDKKTDRICGWMICRNMGDRCAEVARYYILPQWRKGITGIYLGGYLLRKLAGTYDTARMKILPHNRPLLAFMRGFFRESITEVSEKIITIKWKE